MKITLQKMRWIASGALIFCFVGMIGCRLGEAHWHSLAWPLAFFEAATVGALADWFAVVALFRHPLGIPIPHTAILPNNKARVAESLATFLEEGFLTEAQLGPRIRQIDFAGMISRWLSTNAESLSRRVGKFAPVLVERIPSEQITSLLTQRARYVILTANAAPLLASGLQTLTGSGRDREIFNSMVISFRDLISENRETIQTKISEEVPISSDLLNAIPFLKNAAGPALDHFRNQIAAAVANRTIEKIHTALNEACSNQDHPLWVSFQTRLNRLITDLESSPELAARVRAMQEALANSPLVDNFFQKALEELADFLKRDLAAADSVILQKISEALLSASRELTDPPPARRDQYLPGRASARSGVGSQAAHPRDRHQHDQSVGCCGNDGQARSRCGHRPAIHKAEWHDRRRANRRCDSFALRLCLKIKSHNQNIPPTMNPHDEITPADIQAALDALSLPSPTQLTVNISRKLYNQGTHRVVDGNTIRKLTAELRAKNQAVRRRRSS